MSKYLKKSVFITRDLVPDSNFLRLLSKEGWNVKGRSLLEFEGVPFSYPSVDWIFFYSKNGIKFFFDYLKLNGGRWRTFLKRQASDVPKLAVMSKASAEYLLEYDLKADFIGTGDASTAAPAFLQMSKGQAVLFPHAKNSLHSIRKIIENEVNAIDVVVYENRKITDFSASDAAVLVFTSPMNVEAYFEKYELRQYQKLVAIGHTTATKLIEMGFDNIQIADAPNEVALAESVMLFN